MQRLNSYKDSSMQGSVLGTEVSAQSFLQSDDSSIGTCPLPEAPVIAP